MQPYVFEDYVLLSPLRKRSHKCLPVNLFLVPHLDGLGDEPFVLFQNNYEDNYPDPKELLPLSIKEGLLLDEEELYKVNLEKDDLEKLMCFVGTNAALLNEIWQDKIDFEEFIAKANFDENEFDMTWTFDDPEAFKDL